ncbi:MAG: methyltransferase family protein [Candidatus Binatia bacterium]
MKLRTFALRVVVLGTVFVLGPIGFIALNGAMGWPRWESDVARVLGGIVIIAGIAVALYCSSLFARIGQGTPVPIEPPTRLVVAGLYRYSRNPMYVADVVILLGLFLHRGDLTLLLYVGLFVATTHAWVVLREEPVLRKRFGDDYARYERAVPRWISLGYRFER